MTHVPHTPADLPPVTVFDEDAQHIFRKQYALPGETTPHEGFLRVARFIAPKGDEWTQKYYDLMAEKKFCPGGRVLAGAGTQHSNVMNCFVQGNTEHEPGTLEGVMEIARKLALVTKVGGGNGVNLDVYPARAALRNARRGTAYLAATHPDVRDFITGEMRPPTLPNGEKVNVAFRNWDRVVYGDLPQALNDLTEQHGVTVLSALPAGVQVVGDSMEGIMDAAADAVRRSILSENVQLDLSTMRPEGAPISGSGGTSSGPVSFLYEVFDHFMEWANLGAVAAGPVATLRYVYAPVLRVVRQGGTRRGAGMATLSADHPDVLDFLTCKDLAREAAEGDIATFNISILIPDAFYEAVRQDGRWPFEPGHLPSTYLPVLRSGARGVHTDWSAPGVTTVPLSVVDGTVTIPARWLWTEIARHAHATGEPGLIFVDRVNAHSAVRNLGAHYTIRATNPCLRGDTLVVTLDPQDSTETDSPLRTERIDTLAHKGPSVIWTGTRWQETQFRVTGHDQPVFTVTFEHGGSVTATAAHTFVLEHGERRLLQDLRPGDQLRAGFDLAAMHALKGTAEEGHAAFDALYALFGEPLSHAFVIQSIEAAGTEREVYCCTVEGEHTFMLANGLLSGNCGEIPLTVGEPCDLGAINLGRYALDGSFDDDAFRADVRTCVRLLDDLLDVNVFALEDNRAASQSMRRIGLGVMGLADLLIRIGLPYDSEQARELVFDIMDLMRAVAIDESEAIARERGPYPLYTEHADRIPHPPRRNVAVLTVAPTGTTSMLMGASSGLEPLFSPFIYRKIGSEYRPLLHPLFVEMMERHAAPPEYATPAPTPDGRPQWQWDAVTTAISANHGSVVGLDFIPQALQQVFVCAHDVSPLDHVRMQGAVQRAFDSAGFAGNALSKTINLPNTATVDDVTAAYTEAFESGCKGVTVYRDGSRKFQPLNTGQQENADAADLPPSPVAEQQPVIPPTPGTVAPAFKRRRVLHGMTLQIKLNHMETGLSTSYLVTVNQDPDTKRPIEVIVVGGNSGQEAHADAEALGRLTSNALQFGTPAGKVMNTLKGIEGGLMAYVTQPNGKNRRITSKADLIAYALSLALESTTLQEQGSVTEPEMLPLETYDVPDHLLYDHLLTDDAVPTAVAGGSECPSCHEYAVIHTEGCATCQACAYSRCS